jgi:hypothetical protein
MAIKRTLNKKQRDFITTVLHLYEQYPSSVSIISKLPLGRYPSRLKLIIANNEYYIYQATPKFGVGLDSDKIVLNKLGQQYTKFKAEGGNVDLIRDDWGPM